MNITCLSVYMSFAAADRGRSWPARGDIWAGAHARDDCGSHRTYDQARDRRRGWREKDALERL